MVEIRFHGRGGQGTVVASQILATAIAKEGKYIQAYPEFGVERRGAPVFAFIRINDEPIFDKSRIYTPDHVIVLDPTLLDVINITEGLKDGGWIIVNSEKQPEELKLPKTKYKLATVNASVIAVKHELGTRVAPKVSTAIIGALIKILGLVKIDSVLDSIREEIKINPEKNVQATIEAFDSVKTFS